MKDNVRSSELTREDIIAFKINIQGTVTSMNINYAQEREVSRFKSGKGI